MRDPENQLSHQDEELGTKTLHDYLMVARKYWWIIALVFCAGVATSVLYTLRQPKVYQASASIVIDPQPPQVFGSQVQEVITLGTGSFWSNQEYYNTQVEIVRGYDLAKLTIDQNELWNEPALLPTTVGAMSEDARLAHATGAFAAGLTATHDRDSRIVTIGVKLEDPDLAVRLANLHVATFLDYTRGLRTGGTGKVSKYLSKELDRAEQQLQASEEAMLEFKRENKLLSTSIEEAQNLLAQELARYTTALGDARIKRTEQGAALKRARALLREDVLESPIFTLAESTGVEELKSQYATESRKLRELSQQFGPKHPEFLGQQKQVDAIVGSLRREARRTVRELQERFQATSSLENQFQTEVERLKAEAMELEPKTVQYNRLKRKQVADAEMYDSLRQRLGTSNMTGRNESINIRSHVQARGAGLVSPSMPRNVASAAIVSLLIGLGIAFLLDLLDRTIKSTDQVEALLSAPVLGVIPIVSGGTHDRANQVETKDRDLHIFHNPSSPAAECCRALRTNILFADTDKRMRTLTISSPRPREGKSTTTIYLGTTMAQSGQRVLIVDADLRRPRLHKAMDVSRERGLTTVLLGEATLDEAIKSTEVPGLFVLPAGPNPPNPAELLLTDAFKNLLTQLEGKFDRILLDSPPLLAVSDPVVLARLSDGVLLVVQSGQTRIDDALIGVRSLRGVDAPILGVVLNDINLEDRRYGYGSKYYGYGSYGYGDEAQPEAS